MNNTLPRLLASQQAGLMKEKISMQTYPIPMVPGPVSVPPQILKAYQIDFGSGDLEPEFLELYNRTETDLQKLLGTKQSVVIQTGEGMIALWGALKSCLLPGDRVLSIATGVFGHGIADMAKSLGAVVKTYDFPYNQTICDWENIEKAIIEFNPKMITAVHCETPSGTLNPVERLGELKFRHQVPLLYVDAVASVGGAPVLADAWHIDLALGGSQKCLSVPPAMAFLSVSQRAWEIIEEVNYLGYDALKPFQNAQETFYFPYTPYWHGMAALNAGAELILEEGLENSIARHAEVAAHCRQRIEDMGLSLFVEKGAIPSPTVTAVNMPENMPWGELNAALRRRGMVVGGSYGPLHEKVFRLGHMGSQAEMKLVNQALDVLEEVIK